MRASLTDCVAAHWIWLRLHDYAGACWHVVLEDGNVEDASVDWTINTLDGERGRCDHHADCTAIAPLVRAMSRTQRKKLIEMGYAHAAAEALIR